MIGILCRDKEFSVVKDLDNDKKKTSGFGVSQHPRILGVIAWYQSLGNDNLGRSGGGFHKYGPNTSSSQLGIKSLGTRVPRANGYGSMFLDSLSSGVTACTSEHRYVII